MRIERVFTYLQLCIDIHKYICNIYTRVTFCVTNADHNSKERVYRVIPEEEIELEDCKFCTKDIKDSFY